MKTAIIIHGWDNKEEFFDSNRPSPSNSQWFPWLQKQLLLKGVTAQTPEMPDSYEPNYEKWKKVFEQFHIDEETILVGHSCGGGFLVRWLSEHTVKVAKVLLIAPWIDPGRELGEDNDFFAFTIDPNLAQKTADGIVMFSSSDDDAVILQSVEIIKSILKDIQVREFTDKGHFTTEDGVSKFPELLGEIV